MVTADLAFSLLLAFVVVTAVATALARSLVVTLLSFAAYSLGLAMVWVLLRAPDVALTEAAVGAGVTTALFLLVVRRATRPRSAVETDARQGTTGADPTVGREPNTGDGGSPATDGGRPTARIPPAWRRLRSASVAGLVAVGMLLTVPALPAVGAADAPGFGPVTDFYLTDAADRGIDNVVTAVLVVYRGFDTFGEIVVVLAAAVAVLAVFGREVLA
jgi:multicomponent Na+:H+ antiporter subunit B